MLLGVFTMLVCNCMDAQDFPRKVLPEAVPPYYHTRYEASDKPGDLVYGVTFTVRVPPGVDQLRGVIVHQHGCGSGAGQTGLSGAFDLHWQALAQKHQCALLSPAYEQPRGEACSMWADPRNGSAATFIRALSDLGEKTSHPELATVPWALWGHSGGGNWVGGMTFLYPERTAALWMNSGTVTLETNPDNPQDKPYELSPAVLEIPMMCNQGALEGVTKTDGRFAHVWTRFQSLLHTLRAKGALIGHAVDPFTEHPCGNQRYLAIPWFDACLEARLPKNSGGPMGNMPLNEVWLAPLLGKEAVPASKYEGDIKNAGWLPNRAIAKAWMSYNLDNNIVDKTRPLAPRNLEITGRKLTWDAEADLESGLAYFIIERDGQLLAKVPERDEQTIGRPVFQSLYPGDTPRQPLPKMSFIDSTAIEKKYRYSVIAVNTAGLKSKKLNIKTDYRSDK